ncbi:hypothetical protein ACFL35_08525 [Candidatus Riflebacteria bacterium]
MKKIYLLLFIGNVFFYFIGCDFFNRKELEDSDKTTISGTITFPANTAIAKLSPLRAAVDFQNISIYINNTGHGHPDSLGNYSITGVDLAGEYTVEIKNKNNIVLLKAISITPGVINVNTTTTAVALVYLEAKKSNSLISINTVSANSSAIALVKNALDAALADTGTLSYLGANDTDIFSTKYIADAVQAAAWIVNGTTSTSTSTSSSSTTTSSTTTSTSTSTGGPAIASNFNPADGATGVSLVASLTWSADSGALSTLYLDTTASPSTVAMTASSSTSYYKDGGFQASTTYYWRVDTSEGNISASGPELKFTTGSPPILNSASITPRVFSADFSWSFDKSVSSATMHWLVDNGEGNSITTASFLAGAYQSKQFSATDSNPGITLYGLDAGQKYWTFLSWQDSTGTISDNSSSIASFSTHPLASWTGTLSGSYGTLNVASLTHVDRHPTIATGTVTGIVGPLGMSLGTGTLQNTASYSLKFVFTDEITAYTLKISPGTSFDENNASPALAVLVASTTSITMTSGVLAWPSSWSLRLWYQHGTHVGSTTYNKFAVGSATHAY